jgi:hypothetical protein
MAGRRSRAMPLFGKQVAFVRLAPRLPRPSWPPRV